MLSCRPDQTRPDGQNDPDDQDDQDDQDGQNDQNDQDDQDEEGLLQHALQRVFYSIQSPPSSWVTEICQISGW